VASFYDLEMKAIGGEQRSLGEFRDQVLLAVNAASRCGLTPPYTALEKLHEEVAAKGFSVVGFLCNQFAGQEPGSDAEVKQACSTTYGVTFLLFSIMACRLQNNFQFTRERKSLPCSRPS
jgi:glutathione peroxidase